MNTSAIGGLLKQPAIAQPVLHEIGKGDRISPKMRATVAATFPALHKLLNDETIKGWPDGAPVFVRPIFLSLALRCLRACTAGVHEAEEKGIAEWRPLTPDDGACDTALVALLRILFGFCHVCRDRLRNVLSSLASSPPLQ